MIYGLWVSWLVGYVMGIIVCHLWRKDTKTKTEAPAPDCGYDPENPINGKGHRGERVQICGHEFVRMN